MKFAPNQPCIHLKSNNSAICAEIKVKCGVAKMHTQSTKHCAMLCFKKLTLSTLLVSKIS